MKWISLTLLVIQTSSMVLVLRYSRTIETKGPRYISSTAVVLNELLKLLVSLSLVFIHEGFSPMRTQLVLKKEIIDQPFETMKFLIPAGLYTFQNNLLYLSLSHLNAATFQVTYQLKILTTAIFSVLLLGRELNIIKWVSLLLLMFGVAIVQLHEGAEDLSKHNVSGSPAIGLVAVLFACVSSGFAGVYFEMLLKSSQTSVWIRNVQLCFFAFVLGLIPVFTVDFARVHKGGFFQGYLHITWIVVVLQAFGGLVVASVIRFADNILKGFATSISIICSCVFSYLLLGDFDPSINFFIGTVLVIGATFLYGLQPKASLKSVLPITTKGLV